MSEVLQFPPRAFPRPATLIRPVAPVTPEPALRFIDAAQTLANAGCERQAHRAIFAFRKAFTQTWTMREEAEIGRALVALECLPDDAGAEAVAAARLARLALYALAFPITAEPQGCA